MFSTRSTISLYAFGDTASNCLSKVGRFHAISLFAVTDESSFDENGGRSGISNHIISSVFRSTIFGARVSEHAMLNVISEFFAGFAMIECLQPTDMTFPRRIVVNADEN